MKIIIALIISTVFFAFCVPVPQQPPQSATPPAAAQR